MSFAHLTIFSNSPLPSRPFQLLTMAWKVLYHQSPHAVVTPNDVPSSASLATCQLLYLSDTRSRLLQETCKQILTAPLVRSLLCWPITALTSVLPYTVYNLGVVPMGPWIPFKGRGLLSLHTLPVTVPITWGTYYLLRWNNVFSFLHL